jgi:hypothetical protein
MRAVRIVRSDRAPSASHGPGPFHHVPVGAAARERAIDLLDTIERFDCTTAVVDVSVETAVLCRLAGLRTVVLRQSGRRSDDAHALAHASADLVWIPQHAQLEPHVEHGRVAFSGAFSRYDDARIERCRSSFHAPLSAQRRRRKVVVMLGAGGSAFPESIWARGGAPWDIEVVVLGSSRRWTAGSVRSLGHVDDPLPLLSGADAVISSGGWASVHDLASLNVPNAVVAEQRPFDEQAVRAAALGEAGLVVSLDRWPVPAELPKALERCAALRDDRWVPYYDGQGARRAAQTISEVHHSRA